MCILGLGLFQVGLVLSLPASLGRGAWPHRTDFAPRSCRSCRQMELCRQDPLSWQARNVNAISMGNGAGPPAGRECGHGCPWV